MLVDFLKNNFFVQNSASWVYSKIPAMVDHNLQKYGALKKAFYLTSLERLEGDYLEFGIFTGSSFVFAMRMQRQLQFLGETKTKFFGFDSFSGFGKVEGHDSHPFYLDSIFSISEKKVIGNIKRKAKGQQFQVVPGYFEQTLKGKTAAALGVRKAKVVFIDCDLKDPAALSLEFVQPVLQQGTILIMDDFFSFKGDNSLGVAGAFGEFCAKNPAIEWRQLYTYGYGGMAYIVSKIG